MSTDLPQLVRNLTRLEAAGLLDEFQVDVAEATRGPTDDLHRWPLYRFDVERFASIASHTFGLPQDECHAAACEAILPSTRCGVATEILEEYLDRLEKDSLAAAAARKVRRHTGGRRHA